MSAQRISQARVLDWVAISSSRATFPTQGWNPHLRVSFIAGGFFTIDPPEKPEWSEGGALKSPRPGHLCLLLYRHPLHCKGAQGFSGVQGVCLSLSATSPSSSPLARKTTQRGLRWCHPWGCWVSVDARWEWSAERKKKLRRVGFLPDTPAEDPLAQGAQHLHDPGGGHCGQSPRSGRSPSLIPACLPSPSPFS